MSLRWSEEALGAYEFLRSADGETEVAPLEGVAYLIDERLMTEVAAAL